MVSMEAGCMLPCPRTSVLQLGRRACRSRYAGPAGERWEANAVSAGVLYLHVHPLGTRGIVHSCMGKLKSRI